MAWNVPAAISAATDRTAAWFNAIMESFAVLRLHTHAGGDGQGDDDLALKTGGSAYTSIPGNMYTVDSGGTTITALGSDHLFNNYAQSATTQNSVLVYSVHLAPGIYTLKVVYRTDSASGIITMNIDAVFREEEIDGYSSGTVYDNVATFTNIVITAGGLHEFGFITATKNASSSNYRMVIQGLTFYRTDSLTGAMADWFEKTFVANTVLTAADLNGIRDNFVLLEQHTHNGQDGGGLGTLNSAAGDEVNCDAQALWMCFPKAQTGYAFSSLGYTSTAQNDEVTFPVHLRTGTWELRVAGTGASGSGISTFSLDGVDIGTMDWYAAIQTSSIKTIGSIAVAADGVYDLKARMATKNASSSGYRSDFAEWLLYRTGA